jgi:hypothetical protein
LNEPVVQCTGLFLCRYVLGRFRPEEQSVFEGAGIPSAVAAVRGIVETGAVPKTTGGRAGKRKRRRGGGAPGTTSCSSLGAGSAVSGGR